MKQSDYDKGYFRGYFQAVVDNQNKEEDKRNKLLGIKKVTYKYPYSITFWEDGRMSIIDVTKL